MAFPSVTYTFSNSTTADASAANQNFTDLINGMSDGTKDFNISALTCAGVVTFNGSVLLGNASSDDVQFNGSLATSIPIKTQRTYDLGSATLGLKIAYLGMNSTYTVALQAPSSGASASYSLTLPATVGVAGQGLVNTGSGTLAWKPQQTDTAAKSADYTITDSDAIRTLLVTAASDVTITLPTAADNTYRRIEIKKVDSGSGSVIIDGEGTETIDGASTLTLYNQYDSVTIICDGSNWYVVDKQVGAKSLSNAEATRLGLKVYSHGTTYNGGNAPTVAYGQGSGSLSSVELGEFMPYQTQDGNWRVKFNIAVTASSTARTLFGVDVNGITTGTAQGISASYVGGTINSNYCYVTAANRFVATHDAGTTSTYVYSGDIKLSSKPTWAY